MVNLYPRFVRVAVLGLIAALFLIGCSSATSEKPPAPQSAPSAPDVEPASEEAQQITGDVAATVEAAIALAVEATIAARDAGVPPAEEDSAAAANTPTAEVVEAAADDHDTMAEAPVLFTPTPDQSRAIAEFVHANTRHFDGNPDAKVVLVEFSDFW